MKDLKIKVCGMTDPENLRRLGGLSIDFVGFIFYDQSSRYVRTRDLPGTKGVERVGVFVNESTEGMMRRVVDFDLTHVQLHGDESPAQCLAIKKRGLRVLKAVNIDQKFDFESLNRYSGSIDYFLFDAKGPKRGGNGIAFDWEKLRKYNGEIPFFLSGGIGPGMEEEIMGLKHRKLYAIDINSRFETRPGVKDVDQVRNFLKGLKVGRAELDDFKVQTEE